MRRTKTEYGVEYVETFYGDWVASQDIAADGIPQNFITEIYAEDIVAGRRAIIKDREHDYVIMITIEHVDPEKQAFTREEFDRRGILRPVQYPHRAIVISGHAPSGSVYTAWRHKIIAVEKGLTVRPKYDTMESQVTGG